MRLNRSHRLGPTLPGASQDKGWLRLPSPPPARATYCAGSPLPRPQPCGRADTAAPGWAELHRPAGSSIRLGEGGGGGTLLNDAIDAPALAPTCAGAVAGAQSPFPPPPALFLPPPLFSASPRAWGGGGGGASPAPLRCQTGAVAVAGEAERAGGGGGGGCGREKPRPPGRAHTHSPAPPPAAPRGPAGRAERLAAALGSLPPARPLRLAQPGAAHGGSACSQVAAAAASPPPPRCGFALRPGVGRGGGGGGGGSPAPLQLACLTALPPLPTQCGGGAWGGVQTLSLIMAFHPPPPPLTDR
ncbi:translation initiation factor IF-2-like [Dermochelys coriacea]|uniref:translation initiation factor IF-2-like n=1 Tax=Dermochelys coriacea TaxID=27794 RepID=UPI001CA959DD|nr:translation initiation factor IF-2-like [Dermochelys coriacea]